MRIDAAKFFPMGRVVVTDNCRAVARGLLADLVWFEGDDSFVEVFLNADDVPGFMARFFPSIDKRKRN